MFLHIGYHLKMSQLSMHDRRRRSLLIWQDLGTCSEDAASRILHGLFLHESCALIICPDRSELFSNPESDSAHQMRDPVYALQVPRWALDWTPARKRSEGEANTDCRSQVAVMVIGDAGAMRNCYGQTAVHVGIRNSGEAVETLGEAMV